MSQTSQLAMMSTVSAFVGYLIPFIWASITPIIYALVKFIFGKDIMLRTLTASETDKIMPKIWGRSHHGSAGMAFVCGKWFIGILSTMATDQREVKKCTILALDSFFVDLEMHTKSEGTYIYEHKDISTNNWNNDFAKTVCKYGDINPTEWQKKLCDVITTSITGSRTLICGPPGAGKSHFAMILAEVLLTITKKSVNIVYLTGFGESGTNLERIITKCRGVGEVLIVVIDEIDIALERILAPKKTDEMIKTTPNGKDGFNALMDSLCRSCDSNLYLIFTSNKSVAYFEGLGVDPSLLRAGRITVKCDINNNQYAIFDLQRNFNLYISYIKQKYDLVIKKAEPMKLMEWTQNAGLV
jgi:hypothetical protein